MASTSPPAGPLSAADALLLNRYGHDTIRDVVGITSESVFCSAYGIFFALAMYSICRNGFRSRRAIIMSLVVVYLYAASVTQWAVDSYTTLKNIYCLYMTTDVALPDRAELGDEVFEKFAAAQQTIFDLNMIVADAVLIWRTWAVYQGRIRAIAIPCVLLLTAFVFALIDITCDFAEGQLAETTCRPPSGLIVWSFSVGTNVVCTAFIGWKAWQHRKVMKHLNTGGKYHGMSTENILSLLVESGLIYSALWIIQIIGYLDLEPYSPLYYFLQVLAGLGHQMTGLYPTLIIVIVNFKRTIWEHPITLDDPTYPNSLQWAVKTNRSGATRKSNACPEVSIHLETVGEVMRGDSRIDQ
ncbi:hypothetical protein C8R45DRAFT_1105006 [Mycena sanguinolenta]|nr:hypothetical protein C8R45DRAFT_1105006 [Mycena sanguinolenta]